MDDQSARPGGVPPIAVVRGAPGRAVQDLLWRFGEALSTSARVAGAVERDERSGAKTTRLRGFGGGPVYPVFQDLGAGAAGCALDAGGVVAASESLCARIAAGCDLVVISKFGKLEAELGSGFVAAFAAAIEAEVPVLTAVSPRFDAAWHAFAAPFYMVLPAEEGAIASWWQAVKRPCHA